VAFWINNSPHGRLGTAARPRGGDWLESEAAAMRCEGIDILVSLLTPEEDAELDLSEEADAVTNAGMEFRQFPIPDRDTPASPELFRRFLEELHSEELKGKNIVAHCRAGIGRSSLFIALLLILDGYTLEQAFEAISQARGLQVPDTQEQVEWVRQFMPVT
jgi:protein-tyrosine phosphatase